MQRPSAINNIVLCGVLYAESGTYCSVFNVKMRPYAGAGWGELPVTEITAGPWTTHVIMLHTCTYCCILETIWNPGLRKNMKKTTTRKSKYISISNMYFLFQLLAMKDNASQAAVHLYVVPDVWQCTSKGKIVWTWKAKSSSYPPCIHVPQSISKSKPQKGHKGPNWNLMKVATASKAPWNTSCSPPKGCGLDDMAMDQ